MTKQYKAWIYIEEIDEEIDYYADVSDIPEGCSPYFDTLEEAKAWVDEVLGR